MNEKIKKLELLVDTLHTELYCTRNGTKKWSAKFAELEEARESLSSARAEHAQDFSDFLNESELEVAQ